MRKIIVGASLLVCMVSGAASAQDVAFRIERLDLREPHVFTTFLFCIDITGELNNEFYNSIQNDTDGDGLLDLNLLALFRPLDQSGTGGELDFGLVDCTAPIGGTTCSEDPLRPLDTTVYTNNTGDPCLVPNPEYVRPYDPPITESSSPCFSTDPIDITLSLAGVPVPMEAARLSATYVGDPAAALINGVIEGFVSEADADGAIIPEGVPLVGGLALSALLPGGSGNCSSNDDRNIGPDGTTVGWWMYLNYEASEVPFSPPVAVGEAAIVPIALSVVPNPSPASSRVGFELDAAGPVRLDVYDTAGRRVRTLHDGVLTSGAHTIAWDGLDDAGAEVSAGVYLYRLSADGRDGAGKLVLVR